MTGRVAVALALAVLPAALAAQAAWDPRPWLADLAQVRAAVDRDYPNRDWLTGEREVSLDRWFDRAAAAIRAGGDDAAARRALDRLIERFEDGHVSLTWPAPSAATPAAAPPPATAAAFCAAQGYDAAQVSRGSAAALPGYRAIDAGQTEGGPFAAGIVEAGDTKIGVVRIGVFQPQGYPALCEAAVAEMRVSLARPCDAACEDQVLTHAYAAMTRGLIATVERLRSAGATVLLVDLSRNGGGSEWAEAAARVVSPVPLRSARVMVRPGPAWVDRWRALATRLRGEQARVGTGDRTLLRDYAARADAVADGLRPCDGAACPRLVQAGYASGLLAELPAGRLAGRGWAPHVFGAAQFPYRDAVWQGPLIVLVDSETWSAAEQFAALLQDNRAAIVLGGRTGGAGCGHLHGKAPVRLANGGATLELPNCARLRRDGGNEVGGVVPDVGTGVRPTDGAAYAGRLTAARLPQAIVAARVLFRTERDPDSARSAPR